MKVPTCSETQNSYCYVNHVLHIALARILMPFSLYNLLDRLNALIAQTIVIMRSIRHTMKNLNSISSGQP